MEVEKGIFIRGYVTVPENDSLQAHVTLACNVGRRWTSGKIVVFCSVYAIEDGFDEELWLDIVGRQL